MENIKIDGNNLLLPNMSLEFDANIDRAIVYDDKVVVLTDEKPESKNYKNIVAFDFDGKFLWNVQSVQEAYPQIKEPSHFVGMVQLTDGNISASNFSGLNFTISSQDGKILAKQDAR